jgi:arylsulfatase A-like enzyme
MVRFIAVDKLKMRKECSTMTFNFGNVRFEFCLVWFCLSSLTVAGEIKPNLIFILVDDQGYYDLGCYGGTEFDTPRIDKMAREGIRFTDYYAATPICSPSRAGILTGCYPRRVGLATWVLRADSRKGIHPDELTLAELLQSSGYATACVGKWHLGFLPPFLPRRQGFDHYFGLLHNLDPVETVYFKHAGGVPLIRNGKVVKRPVDPAELTEAYADEAIQFIRKNKDRPFFLYLPHTMAHVPMGVTDEFKGKSRFGLYGDVIQCLDHHVGRLLDTLTELDIADRTLVVYASDNGRGPGRTKAQPIRGSKLTTWEGGIRVPCIAWGPGLGVKPGRVSSQVINAMDWHPTLATFAGIEVPAGRIIDGRDITPLLTGRTKTIPPPAAGLSLNAAVPLRRPWNPPGEWTQVVTREEYLNAFFCHGSLGSLAAVRWDKWKLRLNPRVELYDLENDPGEGKPVRNGKLIRKLRGMAILFQEEMRRGARPAGELPHTE